jgi:hypothetical protein
VVASVAKLEDHRLGLMLGAERPGGLERREPVIATQSRVDVYGHSWRARVKRKSSTVRNKLDLGAVSWFVGSATGLPSCLPGEG